MWFFAFLLRSYACAFARLGLTRGEAVSNKKQKTPHVNVENYPGLGTKAESLRDVSVVSVWCFGGISVVPRWYFNCASVVTFAVSLWPLGVGKTLLLGLYAG